jgi:hypothetical protein
MHIFNHWQKDQFSINFHGKVAVIKQYIYKMQNPGAGGPHMTILYAQR